MLQRRKLTTSLIMFCCVLMPLFGSTLAAEEPVVIGVLAHRGPEQVLRDWLLTANYLSEVLPEWRFEIVPLGFDEVRGAVAEQRIDFLLSNPGIYVEMERDFHATRIATQKILGSDGRGHAYFGGVLFSRSDQPLTGIPQLRGKALMAVDPTSFGGAIVVLRELREAGYKPDKVFSHISYGGTHDAVVKAVMDGLVDVGTVRTNTLERMAQAGIISLDEFHLIPLWPQDQYSVDFPFLCSTRLYPDWPMAKLKHVSEDLARMVAVALMSIEADHPAARAGQITGWTIPQDYAEVHAALRLLKLGPYSSPPQLTYGDFIRLYWKGILTVIILLLMTTGAMVYFHILSLRLQSSQRALEKNRDALNAAYLELQQSQSRMLQQDKMASIGQLAAGVAHEINNPLGFIGSNLNTLEKYWDKFSSYVDHLEEMLRQGLDEEGLKKMSATKKQMKIDFIQEDTTELLEESGDGVERVRTIVANLKGFSRVDQARYDRVDINQCLESTLTVIWNELKYNATLHKDYGELPMACCYPQQLNQVFMNLLINAGHALGQSGDIHIRTRCEEGMILVSIQDSGCGIPEEHLSRLFEPFFTTKEVGKGTGLGLSIAYDIVKKHSGEIQVASVVGEGTVFTVKIPVVEDLPQEN